MRAICSLQFSCAVLAIRALIIFDSDARNFPIYAVLVCLVPPYNTVFVDYLSIENVELDGVASVENHVAVEVLASKLNDVPFGDLLSAQRLRVIEPQLYNTFIRVRGNERTRSEAHSSIHHHYICIRYKSAAVTREEQTLEMKTEREREREEDRQRRAHDRQS